MPHNRLLHKLHHYGIRGELNNWISSFLKTRYHRVVVDGAHSDCLHVDSGVPVGTVLGPLLFLAHINDLPTTIQSQCRLFADDCLLYRPIHSLQDQLILQEDLQQLQHWTDDWGMRFNASKCQLLRISRSQHPLGRFYTISDQILQQVPSAKYLSILLNDQLKWDTHIDSITARANSTIEFLRRNLSLCTRDLRELAYFSLARSVLEYMYACQVWDTHLRKDVTGPATCCALHYARLFHLQQRHQDAGWPGMGAPIYKASRPSPVADVSDHPWPGGHPHGRHPYPG